MATKQSIARLSQNLNMMLSALAGYLQKQKEKEAYENTMKQASFVEETGAPGLRDVQQIGQNVAGAVTGQPSMQVPLHPGFQPPSMTEDPKMRALANMMMRDPTNQTVRAGVQGMGMLKNLGKPDFILGPNQKAYRDGEVMAEGTPTARQQPVKSDRVTLYDEKTGVPTVYNVIYGQDGKVTSMQELGKGKPLPVPKSSNDYFRIWLENTNDIQALSKRNSELRLDHTAIQNGVYQGKMLDPNDDQSKEFIARMTAQIEFEMAEIERRIEIVQNRAGWKPETGVRPSLKMEPAHKPTAPVGQINATAKPKIRY
jgi:hypothetical protein